MPIFRGRIAECRILSPAAGVHASDYDAFGCGYQLVPRIEEIHHGVFRIFGLEPRVDLRFRQSDDRLSQNNPHQIPGRCLGEDGLSVLLLLLGCFRREVLGVEGKKTGREAAQVLQLRPVGGFPVRAGSVEQDLTYREYPRSGLLEHFAISSMFGDEFGDIDMFPEKSRSRMKGPQKQLFARVVGQDESGLAVLARLAAADGASPAHDRSNQ